MTTQLDTNNDQQPLSVILGKAKDRKEVNVYIENKYEPIIDTLKELSLISFSHAKNKITHQFYIPSYFNDYVKVFVCASAQGSVVGILSIDIDDAGPKYKGILYDQEPAKFIRELEGDAFNLFNGLVRIIIRQVPVQV
jgi:hypothetical protein